jgi:hypothetical protein
VAVNYLDETAPDTWQRRARRVSLPVVLWAFGFATTLLLIGMWGRTVTVDSGTVQDAARTVVDSELATERVYTWLESGLQAAMSTDAETAGAVASGIAERPEFDRAVDTLVTQFVASLFAEPGDDTVVNVGAALAPLVPVVVEEAAERDVPVEAGRIESALEDAPIIPLDTGEAATVASAVHEARGFLTWVVAVSAGALLVTGAVAVALSDRRYVMVRTLSTRVLISAVTYAILFQVAAWALDPARGRSPVLGGGSILLGSNGHVFLIAAGLAALVGVWGGTVAWRRTAQRRMPDVDQPSAQADDDTRELLPV